MATNPARIVRVATIRHPPSQDLELVAITVLTVRDPRKLTAAFFHNVSYGWSPLAALAPVLRRVPAIERRAPVAPLRLAHRAVHIPVAGIAAIAQGGGHRFQKGAAVGNVKRPGGGVHGG